MPKFSKYFRLNAGQSELDFVDVNTDLDTPVFVDPFAIEIRSDPWSNRCAESIRIFFDEVLSALRSKDNNRARYLVGQLSEPQETYLGLSSGKPQGRGVGRFQADLLLKSIRNSEAFKTGDLQDLSELALYVEGVGRDKISDLTTNLIRGELASYTREHCRLLKIPLQNYSGPAIWDSERREWISREIELPLVNGEPVLLIPKAIVRRSLSLEAGQFYQKHILNFLQSEHVDAHGSLTALVRGKRSLAKQEKGKVKKPTKKALQEAHPKSSSLILDLTREHPELLDYYKKIARERREPITINEDDTSISRACVLLGDKLKNIPAGKKHADEYHRLCLHALTTLFYPELPCQWRNGI